MKKINWLLPITAGFGTIASVTPLFTLTSCGKKAGNLMVEYTPDIAPREYEEYRSPAAALDVYLEDVEKNNEIFVQDIKYTLSRGMPQYISYVSEYCEISSTDFNMEADKVVVDKDNRTITFDATFHISFDYSKTKREEMIWYDMFEYKWDTETKIELVLDFNTNECAPTKTGSIYSAQKQMTTYAGATQFGVSEVNSTIRMISEKGSCVDIDNKTHNIDIGESQPYHFMLPNKDYWDSKGTESKYDQNYEEVWNLWFDYTSLQMLVLMFKYYMPNNVCLDPGLAPNTFDFGSYYMQNASLTDTFAVVDAEESENEYMLCGFNKSLDSINNYRNLQKQDRKIFHDNIFTLPVEWQGGTITRVAPHAFDGDLNLYTNFGIPIDVNKLVIPGSIKYVYEKAFSMNSGLSEYNYGLNEIEIQRGNEIPRFGVSSFYQLLALNKVDLHSFDPNDYSQISEYWQNAFDQVHIPLSTPGIIEGEIIIPKLANLEQWKTALANAGFAIYNPGVSSGWDVKNSQE